MTWVTKRRIKADFGDQLHLTPESAGLRAISDGNRTWLLSPGLDRSSRLPKARTPDS